MRTLLRIARTCGSVGALCVLLCCVADARGAAAVLQPCRIKGVENDVLCGRVQRPLDPSRPTGSQIDVHFAVLPAIARNKLPDPVFFFAGGPGQAAMRLGAEAALLLKRLHNRRDLVLIDQRGTGRSAPLECRALPPTTPLQQQVQGSRWDVYLADCLAQLQKLPYGDLRFFTTTIAMQDADAVRQALGVDRINAVGGSYGTRAVLEYLRAFPRHVRRAVIDGVAPPDMALPQSLGQDGQQALDAWLSSCEKETGCAQRHPVLRQQWKALLASLPKEVSASHPVTGQPERFVLTRLQLLSLVRSPLYAPMLAAALPLAIAQAAQDHFEPLLGLAAALGGGKGLQLAMGMHLSVICAEDMALQVAAPSQAAADFGDAFAQQYADICAHWPRGDVPAAFHSVPRSDVPTQVLSGGLDPVTPPRHGERIAQALGAKARHIIVPNVGHGVMAQPCVPEVLHRFIDSPADDAALAVDARCATAIPRPLLVRPFAMESSR
jgi:pimeloyl-ACP methyl ester carboxylesterase